MWLKHELVIADGGGVLPAGMKVDEWIDTGSTRLTSADIAAAQDCADRLRRETGVRPVITLQTWGLFVIDRKHLTDRRPIQIGGADDRAVA